MINSRPIFVVGTGRCGTRSIFKMLSGTPGVEIHHEYDCTHLQKQAALHYMTQISDAALRQSLQESYGSAIFYSDAATWIDCSNKASWIMHQLHSLLPEARFVVLYRDGRKVVASFFNKLAQEIYDDESVGKLTRWLENPDKQPQPPAEKNTGGTFHNQTRILSKISQNTASSRESAITGRIAISILDCSWISSPQKHGTV